MAVIIGSARIDERGKARGGKAGDNNGREVSTQTWYNRITNPWVVLRPKIPAHAEKIARAMEMACANQHIGYDQGGRDTLYSAAAAYGYDVSKVTKAVETDCSALVRVCCAYAGIRVGNFRTTTEASVLMATGYFEKFTASKFVHSSAYLRRGDVLVTKRQGHTVVVLTDGPKAGKVYGYGERIIGKGANGPDVTEMQRYLLALKYAMPKYGADGDFGAETLKAVKAFQADAGLDVDGVMDAADLIKLKEIAATGWPKPEPPATDEKVYRVTGIIPDVSSNQGKIQSFDKFCAGTDFAIFRVVRGNGLIDTQAVYNMRECQKRGYPFGVYIFFNSRTEAAARAEVRKLFSTASPYGPRFYVLDIEKWLPAKAVLAAVDEARKLGVPMLASYMGEYRWRTRYRKILEALVDFVWIANYGKNNGTVSKVPKVPHDIHQYTSVATVPGISDKTCDRNRLSGRKPLSYFTGRKYEGDK